MRTLRLTLEYDGTPFSGWQRQTNAPTVQQALEEALAALTGTAHIIRGAGRTDAGVHATGQVASFSTSSTLPTRVFLRGLNAHLPSTIAVTSAEEAPPEFDARHSASGKLYRYQIWNTQARSPLRERTHWHIHKALDIGPMEGAAQLLTGRHDFAAFRAADCERKTTTRTVRRISVLSPEPNAVHIEVEATAFLKNMVRILTGTLVYVGHGKFTLDHVHSLLQSGDRRKAGPTAPAHGLTLVRVDYGERLGP